MVWHHPAVCQVDILLKLHSDHFRIYLNDCANQPVADATAISIMVAIDLNMVADLV